MSHSTNTHGNTQKSSLYLELMKKCLTDTIYFFDHEQVHTDPSGLCVAKKGEEGLQYRSEGKDWPKHAHTMIGLKRLDNIQQCLEDVLHNNIEGDCIETGVWRGGATIFMRAILKYYNNTDKIVWVADSFRGLPKPDSDFPYDLESTLHSIDFLRADQQIVEQNFHLYNLLDDQVQFLSGWFKDTLPSAPIDKISILRLDGDMYESTMTVLLELYEKVSLGGFIIIDDYGAIPACKKAVDDFRLDKGIEIPFEWIDWTGIFWKK